MKNFVEGPRIYNLFPLLAGTVAAWEKHLDRIAAMGFNWVFINPFHTTGASGSLYAVADYYRLNPVFRGRSKRSDDDLLKTFIAAAEKKGIAVMMDLVVNHTAIDGLLTKEHRAWFVREPDGSLRSPFCVDPADTRKKTVWKDLAEIDYSSRPERQEIIDYLLTMMRHYTGLGIHGFRCDAAYQVPQDVWRQLIDGTRSESKDCVFIAENLGAMMEQVDALQAAGFDFLFNSSKWWDFKSDWLFEQYDRFRHIAPSIAFPETHDTDRLVADLNDKGIGDAAAVERCYRQSYLFAAIFSSGVMIPMGFEYGFKRRLHVVETTTADWETPAFDLCTFIGDVNRMRASVPALNVEGPQKAFLVGDGRVCCLVRRNDRGPDWVVSLVNLDPNSDSVARLDGLDGDISDGREVTPGKIAKKTVSLGAGSEVKLAPAEVRVIASR